jgi:hypothetical protein
MRIVKWSSWCIVGFGVRRYCILARLSRYLGNMVMGVHPQADTEIWLF